MSNTEAQGTTDKAISQPDKLTEVGPDSFVDASGRKLSPKEVRNIVTPHDFNVAAALFGRPLASPWRRGVAMALDGLLITLLAGGGLVFVAPVYGYLIWRCHQLNKKRRNILLSLLPLVLLFAYAQDSKNSPEGTAVDLADAISISVHAVRLQSDNCDALCADSQSDLLIESMLNENFTDEQAQSSLRELLQDTVMSEQQQQQKLAKLQQRRQELAAARQLLAQQAQTDTPGTEEAETSWWQRLQQSDHSIVKWVQGILADLGISFGWAVAYFTVFVSWNAGQTPGKHLLSIRIVQLDNKPLSLWGAFGRQGGYSAGIATGLLGFAQIYWDPNRQAMQDKLADTLVLLEKKPL